MFLRICKIKSAVCAAERKYYYVFLNILHCEVRLREIWNKSTFLNDTHMLQHFSIFKAVWRSHNLERVYIFSTKAVLRPPCRRYRGGSSTKKIDNPKILDMCFFVFRYLKPFDAHTTSNVCIYF